MTHEKENTIREKEKKQKQKKKMGTKQQQKRYEKNITTTKTKLSNPPPSLREHKTTYLGIKCN